MTQQEIFERTRKVLASTQLKPESDITLGTHLDTELQMDSLDTVEFCVSLGDEFNIAIEPRDIQPRTVENVVRLVADKLNAASS
jgi:acyl carrier protein